MKLAWSVVRFLFAEATPSCSKDDGVVQSLADLEGEPHRWDHLSQRFLILCAQARHHLLHRVLAEFSLNEIESGL
jgi:hypothetical protein